MNGFTFGRTIQLIETVFSEQSENDHIKLCLGKRSIQSARKAFKLTEQVKFTDSFRFHIATNLKNIYIYIF